MAKRENFFLFAALTLISVFVGTAYFNNVISTDTASQLLISVSVTSLSIGSLSMLIALISITARYSPEEKLSKRVIPWSAGLFLALFALLFIRGYWWEGPLTNHSIYLGIGICLLTVIIISLIRLWRMFSAQHLINDCPC